MSIGNTPAVFVSSTFFDLKQVRADLKQFFESMGLEPILSEMDSFPIDPDKTTVENCLRVVDENADILVLVVGGRYGSVTDTKKSITNREYLRAKAKGIPVYVFVDQKVLHNLPAWKDNPDSDFSSVVETPMLFEFVESLLGQKGEGVWVTPFSYAAEITSTLKKQLAYLFKDCLNLRLQLRENDLPAMIANLRGEPLRIAIERPRGWEFRLFSAVLVQEFAPLRQHRFDHRYKIAFGPGAYITDIHTLIGWSQQKMSEIRRIAHGMKQVMNVALKDGMGPMGVAGDPELLVYAARGIALSYRTALEWSLDTERVGFSNDEFANIIRLVGKFMDCTINDIEKFAEFVSSKAKEVSEHLVDGNETPINISYTMEFSMGETDEFDAEINRLVEMANAGEL